MIELIDDTENEIFFKNRIEKLNYEIDSLNNSLIDCELRLVTAINFIDEVLSYDLLPFDYDKCSKDINTLIGILRGSNE